MHFDDSLFEDSSKQQESSVDVSKIRYSAKRCELNWFTEANYADQQDSTAQFMLHKYRADLLYVRKQYKQALVEYEATLASVPPTNTVVIREVSDCVARCRLHLGQPELALEKAQLLVHALHENDSSAWKLIADCHKRVGATAAQVSSLQKCTLLQRYQFDYWTDLAEAYGTLSEHFSHEEKSSHMEPQRVSWEEIRSILDSTLTLFRPYFSWVPLQKRVRKETISEQNDHLICHPSCVLHKLDSCEYLDTLSRTFAEKELSVASHSTTLLCLPHSLFTMLNSGQINVSECVERLSASNHRQFVRECLRGFLAMARCSCLLWARQLLLYFVRYSHSFVTEAHKSKTVTLDKMMASCDQDMKDFLETYFNKNRVFEESQHKDDKQ